ncbi:hypothetical protein [Candidatus Nanosynbacter sp. TM7-057]|uniref:hypothetical protein n=1 Tax=Candidatus Nanosynbacter sp. TM7-057 TaxID=2902630 RepID=UPI001FB7131B|nr:hypothetical protein [Candidatus Nanosynbacter sp. TM7-057]MCJ1965193.1 hypothetical protein [Candidatus Nanosynbacter sp. TM7-057]
MRIAISKLEALICSKVGYIEEERTFQGRDGMRSVFIGLCSEVKSVKVNSNSVDFATYLGDNASQLCDNIVLNKPTKHTDVITVHGGFGLKVIPEELVQVISELFAVKLAGGDKITSKKVEDFSITYDKTSELDRIIENYKSILDKYSQCSQITLRSGEIRNDRIRCI